MLHKLRYITAKELPNGNLNLKLTSEGRQEIKELQQKDGWLFEHILLELIEDSRCNSGFDIVMPEHIGIYLVI